MGTAKVVWFDPKKGIGEAVDDDGRTIFLSALEIVPTKVPTQLKPNDSIEFMVKKVKGGFAAKQITRLPHQRKRRSDREANP
jgi:cold shock CspA family protein